jgi:hypothetical protein
MIDPLPRLCCKTCRHWLPGPQNDGSIPDWCPPEYGECHSPKVGALHSMASYEPIGTGPEFGCVEWEAKPVIVGLREPLPSRIVTISESASSSNECSPTPDSDGADTAGSPQP